MPADGVRILIEAEQAVVRFLVDIRVNVQRIQRRFVKIESEFEGRFRQVADQQQVAGVGLDQQRTGDAVFGLAGTGKPPPARLRWQFLIDARVRIAL